MSDLSVVGLTLIVFAVGIFGGSLTAHLSWTKDCEAIGMHRHYDSVYKCELRK